MFRYKAVTSGIIKYHRSSYSASAPNLVFWSRKYMKWERKTLLAIKYIVNFQSKSSNFFKKWANWGRTHCRSLLAGLSPKIVRPTRTLVDSACNAWTKSSDIPMLNSKSSSLTPSSFSTFSLQSTRHYSMHWLGYTAQNIVSLLWSQDFLVHCCAQTCQWSSNHTTSALDNFL